VKKIKFLFVSGIVFLSKIGITGLLSLFSPIFFINYFITHSIIIILSFFFHSRITFKEKLTWKKFYKFIKMVMVLKIIDYGLANFGVYVFDQYYIYAIVMATIIVIILRYIILDRYVFKKHKNIPV